MAQKEDRFLRGRQIAYLIYVCVWFTGNHDFVENYADLFIMSFRNDCIIRFSMGWNSIVHDEIPQNTSVWETQDGIGIAWPAD